MTGPAVNTADTQGDAAWQAQLSAWLDGEVYADETDGAGPVHMHAAALDALLQTEAAHPLWQNWHVIGDVLRSPQLAIQPSAAFQTRLAQALGHANPAATSAATPPATQPIGQAVAVRTRQAGAGTSKRWRRWLHQIRLRKNRSGHPWAGRAGSIVGMGWQGGGLALASVAALAVAALVWLLVPQFSTYFAGQDAGGPLLVEGGELDGNLYVQAHRQFVGGNPIRQVTLEMGVAP